MRQISNVSKALLASQRFWDHMDRINAKTATLIWKRIIKGVIKREKIDLSSVSYDGTNFYTFIDTFNTRCQIAKRGKNKQGRDNLRQVSYALFCCADGHVPLFYDVYEGNRNDVKQFPLMLRRFHSFFKELSGDNGSAPDTTVIFDKGNNSPDNFGLLDSAGLDFIDSVNLGEHKEVTLIPKKEIIYYELLVLRCQREDKGALEELIHLFERQIFYYIKRLVENEADAWNILQETWIKVIRSIKQIRDPKSLPTWLYSIARKTAMSHSRSKYSKEALIDCSTDITEIEDDTQNLSFDNAEQVHYGLSKISLPRREILTLFFPQDLTLKQIADVLSISIGTVKSRLHYAKHTLRKVLAKEDDINE